MDSSAILNEKLSALIELCQQFKVKRLFAFGSVVTDNFHQETSDIDMVAEMEEMSPLLRGENIIAFWEAVEDLFERKVDLITNLNIRNPYLRNSIDQTKQLIYDREGEKGFG